ncbi:hypothetical protein AC578_7726 [Pseudocercospora eumusae]|uniref:Uncharacterized protein n=1 Tax=Pseudocercospora eumusae TaxID=321146 RepID=A0A139HKZ9_9PEZI|nr:hypothetical protein AC578_7726 [Pseudocercospora eumusae]
MSLSLPEQSRAPPPVALRNLKLHLLLIHFIHFSFIHFIPLPPFIRLFGLVASAGVFDMGQKAAKKVVDSTKLLSEKLLKAFPPKEGHSAPSKRKGRFDRNDVVSEKLCNDVIKYIAPTLEPYKGCTIVDINPGACVWSDKLHRFLKPKCHLLMEPNEEYVEPFIKPLLQKPRSTYVHTSLSGINSPDTFQNWKDIFAKGSFIGRKRLDEDDPNLRRVDTSLLITGSLARRSNDVPLKFPGSNVSLLNASWLSLQNGLFHQAGLVRMLWWLAELDKIALFPYLSYYKSHLSAAVGLSCNTNEVVAVKSSSVYKEEQEKSRMRPRYSGITAESSARVRERMADRGIIVPRGREVHQYEPTKEDTQTQWKSPLAVEYHTLPEFEADFEELSERINKRMAIRAGQRARNSTKPDLQRLVGSIKYPQVYGAVSEGRPKDFLHARKVARNKTTDRASRRGAEPYEGTEPELTVTELGMVLWADFNLHIINLEVHYRVLEENGVDVSAYKPRLASLLEQLDEDSRFTTNSRADVEKLWGNIFDLATPTPILITDRRQYEPLQANPTDFYPAANLCLLDITPNGLDMAVPGVAERGEVTKVWNYLLKLLLAYKSRSVAFALDKIAPNAAKDLIPMVPAITDPRRGGRLDPANVRVRQLTDEMLEGLAKAWMEWPFKPEMHELALEFDESQYIHRTSEEALTPEAVTDAEEE